MSSHRPRPFPHHRNAKPRGLAGAGPRAVRVGWREAVELVRHRAQAVLDGAKYDKLEDAPVANRVVAISSAPFPLRDAPASALAQAFVGLARAFITTTGDERRSRLARLLVAAARELDGLLDEEAVAASEVWQGQSGGRD